MITIRLPYPPSANTYYRRAGTHIHISDKGRRYRQAIKVLVRAAKKLDGVDYVLDGRLRIDANLYPPDRRRRDIDNTLKCLLDSLEKAGVYRDDCQIKELAIKMHSYSEHRMYHYDLARKVKGMCMVTIERIL